MTTQISYLNFQLFNGRSSQSLNKFKDIANSLSEIQSIWQIITDNELKYKAIRSQKSIRDLWIVYQIDLKDKSKKKEKYLFWFNAKGSKKAFIAEFERKLNHLINPPDNLKVHINMDGRSE
ncbi:MAG: hypothetical protein JXB00_09480 [Bacteroidales bacterium]|nr:hypothetical protein [Bacteroidales bacterium]